MGIGYELSIENYEHPNRSRVLAYGGAQLGRGTNNAAEYRALIAGLRHAIRLGFWNVGILSDSLLVVNQVKGKWKIKKGRLRVLHNEVKTLLSLLAGWAIFHVPREQNERADELSHSVCLVEPTLPPKPHGGNKGGTTAALYPWQAAFIRLHWLKGQRNAYLFSRIFNVSLAVVRQIGEGDTYRIADFSTTPTPEQLCAVDAQAMSSVDAATLSEKGPSSAEGSPVTPIHPPTASLLSA